MGPEKKKSRRERRLEREMRRMLEESKLEESKDVQNETIIEEPVTNVPTEDVDHMLDVKLTSDGIETEEHVVEVDIEAVEAISDVEIKDYVKEVTMGHQTHVTKAHHFEIIENPGTNPLRKVSFEELNHLDDSDEDMKEVVLSNEEMEELAHKANEEVVESIIKSDIVEEVVEPEPVVFETKKVKKSRKRWTLYIPTVLSVVVAVILTYYSDKMPELAFFPAHIVIRTTWLLAMSSASFILLTSLLDLILGNNEGEPLLGGRIFEPISIIFFAIAMTFYVSNPYLTKLHVDDMLTYSMFLLIFALWIRNIKK